MRIVRRIDERGATAVEYGLIVGLIALGLLGSLVTTKGSLNGAYGKVATGLSSGTSPASAPQPTVAMNFAGKTVKQKNVYTGCNLGICGASNTTQYTFTDQSNYNYRPVGGGKPAEWHSYDTVSGYEMTIDGSGAFASGDTFYVSNPVNADGTRFIDYMTVNPDGSITGRRDTYTGNQLTSSGSAPAGTAADYQWIRTMVQYINANP